MHELLRPTLLPLAALLIGLLAFAIWKHDHTRRQWAAWLCSIILLLIWLLTEVWTVFPSSDTNLAGLHQASTVFEPGMVSDPLQYSFIVAFSAVDYSRD